MTPPPTWRRGIVRVLLGKAGVEAEQELRDIVHALLPRVAWQAVWGRKGGRGAAGRAKVR